MQAATEAMAQLNVAYAVFRGGPQPTAEENSTSPPPPPDAGAKAPEGSDRVDADPCSLCGFAPAVRVKFHTVTGLVIVWRWGTLDGLLCRRCGEAMYNESQRSTLLKGWWGIIAPIATVVAFLGNLSRIGIVRRLPEPQFRVPGASTLLPHPMLFCKAWFKRPASLLSSGFALLVVAFIVASLVTPVSSRSITTPADAPTTQAAQVATESQPAATSAGGPSVKGVPMIDVTTCMEGVDVEKYCETGTMEWIYGYCWDLTGEGKVQLQIFRFGEWQTEKEFTAKKSRVECVDPKFPYDVTFTQSEIALGSTRYRVRGDTADGYVAEFTVTASAPADYFRTCADTKHDSPACADGLSWASTATCWSNAKGAVVQFKSGGGFLANGEKAIVTKDTDNCYSDAPWSVVAKGTEIAPGDYSYRLYIPAGSGWKAGSLPIEVSVFVK